MSYDTSSAEKALWKFTEIVPKRILGESYESFFFNLRCWAMEQAARNHGQPVDIQAVWWDTECIMATNLWVITLADNPLSFCLYGSSSMLISLHGSCPILIFCQYIKFNWPNHKHLFIWLPPSNVYLLFFFYCKPVQLKLFYL